MLYEHYLDIIDDVADLVKQLEQQEDELVRERVASLLQRLDLMHREGLVRLIDGLEAQGAHQMIDTVVEEDPVVRMVLGVYGLADLQSSSDPGADGPASAGADHTGFFPIERLAVHRSRSDVEQSSR